MKGRRISLVLAGLLLCAVAPIAVSAQVTDLQVTKSGNDAVFSWTTGTANFIAGVSNGDPRFSHGQTLASGLNASPYTYTGALANGQSLQFFDVSGQGDTSPLGNYTGGTVPPPAPIVTSVSPTNGLKVGDLLTVNGSGFSAIAKEDVVHFLEGIVVTANASPAPTTTSFQITIPRGALSGPAWVQVGNQTSGSMSLVILTLAGFTHIRGVAQQPTTKDIWIADGTKAAYLRFSGTAWGRTDTDSPGYNLVGGQGFDSGGYWYAGNSAFTASGTTRWCPTTPPGTGSAFTHIKPSSSDSISVIAAATSPAFTNTAFFAYNDTTASEKHIRELSNSGVVNTDYGNFGATNLNFAGYAGLALDQNGNLFDTETTQVRKVTPSQTSSIVASGFTTAMGVAVDQVNTSDAGMLLISDSGASALVAVDLSQSTATKATIASGLSLPRAASFAVTSLNTAACGGLANTGLSFVLAGEDTQIRQLPDPRITLTPSGPTRVWISKQRTDDTYPSSSQSTDHQIIIAATITPTPTTQRTICFRVVDPPDTAPYGDGTDTGYWCDNKDPGTSNNAGKLWDTGTSTWKDVVCVQTVNGQASVTLNTTDRYAGDNYIVQASFDDWTTNTTKALAETGIITAWKRIYVEKDTMFRRGGLLFGDFNPGTCSPCNQVLLYDWANVADGDTIVVFDETNTAEAGGETRTISGAPVNNGDGSVTVTLNANLTKSYYRSAQDTSTPPNPTFSNNHSGGVGVPSAGYYEADLGDMWQAFDDGFMEFWVPPEGTNAVPYVAQGWFDWATSVPSNLPALNWVSYIWFKNKHLAASPPDLIPSNYFHLIGASSSSIMYGGTWYLNDWTFIFQGKIESDFTNQSDRPLVNQWVTAHELGHQFDVNPVDCSHHDSNLAWCESLNHCEAGGTVVAKCLTNVDQSDYAQRLVSGVTHFCIPDLLTGGEAFAGSVTCNTISEPWNQYDGSLRTDTDPQ